MIVQGGVCTTGCDQLTNCMSESGLVIPVGVWSYRSGFGHTGRGLVIPVGVWSYRHTGRSDIGH